MSTRIAAVMAVVVSFPPSSHVDQPTESAPSTVLLRNVGQKVLTITGWSMPRA